MLPASPLSSLRPTFVRGLYGYEIDQLVCEQPHTWLYHGQRKADGLPVLVKLVRDPGASAWAADWFERDYQMGQELGDPCGGKLLAFERTDCGPALVYADDGARPLEGWSAWPLEVELALTIGASIAEAVSHLHKKRVIHCNLNPSTVWLCEAGGGISFSDFGCARRLFEDGASGASAYDDLLDLRYISPEQSGRLESVVDQRSDIYSLGVILFRLLTGKVPFDGPDDVHIIDGHLSRQPAFPPELPIGLVKLISKVLAKTPDARYLSASALAADLLECRAQWRSSRTISEFELGRYDAKAMLRLSRQVYGRERETLTLLEKTKSAKGGRPGMLLIKGAPGVGKSTLLGQLESFVRSEGGRFVSGKFDQYKRNVPYLAIAQALQQLVGQLLSGTKAELEAWRLRILAAVGNNARVVIDVIPELELITGPQGPVPDLPPAQARNRFNHVFSNLIQALTPRDELLCLAMDDLQWVDAASLALLSHLLTNSETRNILFVGGYRDNEVDPTHPLEGIIHSLQNSNVDVTVLPLGVLKAADVLHLLRDTFNATATEARELAQVLHAKSGGNPLYLSQFLPYLCDEELISFDYRVGKWVWDLAGIQQEGVTQDVLELLKLRLKGLPQGVRTILATAACIGSSFEASKVALAAQQSLVEVLGCLATLTREGLIVTNDRELQAEPHRQLEYESPSQFRFVHDHVQEAGFDCVPEEAKQDFRLQMGRRLLAGLVWDDEHPPPVYVLTNLNSAWQLLADAEEKQRVAEINLVAGRKARRALAYQDALGYISVGLGLLGSRCWSRTYDLAFALHSEAFECEYLTANFERAETLFAGLIANARSKLDKARVYRTKVLLDTSEARYEQALKVGIEALKLFGLSYPRKPSKLHLLAQLMLVRLQMRGRKPHELLQAKVLTDPEKLAVLRLLVALIPTALVLSRDLFVLTGIKIVNYSLRHGIAPASAAGFVLYGFTLGSAMDDFKRGYEFGRLAVELAERDKDPSVLCKVLYLFILIKVWRDPRDEVFPLVERVRRLALEAGDHQFAAMAISSTITPRVISRGNELQEILRLCEEHRPFIEQSKIADMVDMLKMCTNHSLALQGRTACPYSLTDGNYDEIEAELRYQRSGGRIPSFIQYLVRLQLACLFGRAKEAQILCDKLDPIVRSGSGSGYSQIADYYLFRGLVASDALSRARGRAKRIHRKALRHSLVRLHLFAENNPVGFRQNEELLKAEAARVAGRLHASLKHYNCAIELADAGGFIPVFVLANERAARLCLGDGQRRLASWYLACARGACEKWGATAKVAWLNREYAELLPNASLPVARATNGTTPSTEIRPMRRQVSSFDIAAALHASRIMASGETTESVLTHLMQVMRVQAGAETAHLLVLEGGTLRLEASATVDSGVMLFQAPSTDVASSAFSSAIVNHVLHTGHDLLLVDASADARFAQCSYVARRRPKSVLCSALRHQSEVLGVIYLEHAQVAGAFDGQKLEWLRLLATEVGLTVWSARLSRYREYVHKFAPAAVAKEIDSNPASPNLEAKDSDVTILFGDLAGYTRITEQMERRQLDQFMNRILSRFVDEIHRYEGTLLEIRGDELFVLFGDEDHSKHVRKAASAALALSRAAASLQDELSGAHPPIILNMGINSGIASVGLKAVEAASGARWRYGASGTVVNIAARVRELARDGSILMTAGSASRLENEFVLEDQGEHALKNVQNRIHIYRLIGQLQASTS